MPGCAWLAARSSWCCVAERICNPNPSAGPLLCPLMIAPSPQVLLNGTYAAAARSVGRLMQARYHIRPPLQRAADEIELAILAAEIAVPGAAA